MAKKEDPLQLLEAPAISTGSTCNMEIPIEGIKKEDDRKVVGVFRNLENPGQDQFVHCSLYRDLSRDFKYKFFDGEVKEIPYSAMRFINERMNCVEHKLATDKRGQPSKEIGKIKPRFQFQPAGF